MRKNASLMTSNAISDATPMRFRKLRIAWSVGWGLACVLLIALWVRSYSLLELFTKIDGHKSKTTIGSEVGTIYFANFDTVAAYRYSNNSTATHDWVFERGKPVDDTSCRFALDRDENGLYVAVPHWAIAATAAVIGGIIWLPWRFTLRTLLFATTLIAVVLGAIVYAVR